MLGITHILNAAEGKRFGFVNTNNNYYSDTTIKYLGLPIKDLPTTDISKYFYTAANFIDEAISTRGNLIIFLYFQFFIARDIIYRIKFIFYRQSIRTLHARYISQCYMCSRIFNDKERYVSSRRYALNPYKPRYSSK